MAQPGGSTRRGVRWFLILTACSLFAITGASAGPSPAANAAQAGTVPSGFSETIVLSGLTNPTVVRFSPDGRVFVAEKSGVIKVFDSLSDTSPTVFADLSANVHNFWDRGLLGMALDPGFPNVPYVYVLYTYDHELGSANAPPRWGDGCPNPPGATSDGCVVSGRLSRLQAAGDVMTGSEQVLVEDWCQQYPSHSVGTVEFGPDGMLYASAGDGASFVFSDYGQDGSPLNPCGDPPGGAGAALTPPTAEGGSLRSQDLRTSGDPVTLDGSIIRVDPATGAGLPTNPLAGNPDPNARRIIAHGLRNPFRFAFRPGSNEIWVGDVGAGSYEEINRVLNPVDSTIENFGWPCYEGPQTQPGFDSADLNICENLYGQPNADTKPYFSYHHSNKVVSGESCPTGSSSVAGISFEFAPLGSTFPIDYQGALFFADYSRDCIWVMRKQGNPIPSPGSIDTFVADAANPVNLEFGPNGDLFYVDFDGGTIRRISNQAAPPPPLGRAFADPTHYAAGTSPHSAAIADLNGDGKADIAVANSNSNNVSVLLGDGAGGFGNATHFSTGSFPKSVAVADLSGDGKLDLATANQNGNSASVLLGNGNGTFSAPTSFPVCTAAHEVAVGNFNGDTRPDLAVACWGGSVISVLLGTGGGGFGAASNFAAGAAPHSLVVRDFDKNGAQDIAVANHDNASVSILRGNGNGTFLAPVNYAVGPCPHSIRAGDFNGDAVADLATANECADDVSVLIGNANGTFVPAVNFPTGRVPKSIAVGDFNGDGKRDLVTANTAGNYPSGASNPGGDQVSVLLGNGSGSFAPPTNYVAGNTPFSVVVGQLNGDGQPDLVTANWFGNDVGVLINTTTQPLSGINYLSELTWTSMTNGWGPVEKDQSNGENLAGDGGTITLNGTTYYKGLGTHALSDVRYSLSNCSRFLASVGLDDEVGSNGSAVFQVYADSTKVYDSGVMTGTTATQVIDVSIAGASELRLVVTDAGNWVDYDHGDWALARIECGGGAPDTTPPTVTSTTPANGATGVAVGASPTATFSEAMNPATINTGTFTLVQQGTSTPLAATVSYSAATATLDPSANLAPGTTYVATVESGASGVKDAAGNPLAADYSWSFTTATGGNQAPTAVIDAPPDTLTWKVGDSISFSGHAADPEQGTLPPASLSWTLVLQHCPSNCHTHTVQSWSGVASGSFSAPDHEYPSYLELTLTATDASGATDSTTVRLDPQTVVLTFTTSNPGLSLVVNGVSSTTPFTRTVIIGSSNSLSATTPQVLGGTTWEFSSWSDGGAQTHNVVAPATSTTYTATYVIPPPRNTALPTISGQARVGRTLTTSNGSWTGSQPIGFAYQWLRCTTTSVNSCTAISGATANTYVVTSGDFDHRLRVRVTATNAGGVGTATSNATGRVNKA